MVHLSRIIVKDLLFMSILCEMVEFHGKWYQLPLIVVAIGSQNWRMILI